MFKKTSTLILSATIAFGLLLYSSQQISAQNVIFTDNFNNNLLDTSWEIKNYALEELGSFSPYSQLNIQEVGNELKIDGSDGLPDMFLENRWTGWFGKSLIFNNDLTLERPLTIMTEVKIVGGNTGFQTHLTIEFSQNNRIVLSIGDHSYQQQNGPIASQLVFEENNSLRCVNSSIENENSTGCISLPFNLTENKIYHLEIEFDPLTKVVRGKIDGDIVHEGIFKGNLSNPKVGIAATVRDTGDYIDARFDNFSLSTVPYAKSLNVPNIKQFTPPWGPLEYDHANNWSPSNPSVSRWGCALTSASMVLKYYGHDINPDALNEWLSAQKDGYTRNGGIMWPAISRLTYLRNGYVSGLPILEFSYLNFSKQLVKSEIESDRPPILKLLNVTYGGNHFIVGKGFTDSDINVNDPGSNANTTLSQTDSYWGNATKIGRFKKSNTDLSYIVLLIDEGYEIKVSGKSGEILGSEYYFKEGTMSDPNNPNSDSGVGSLNAFHYPKPESGKYIVEILGSGEYTLDSYLYDNLGNVGVSNNQNSITQGGKALFLLDFDKLASEHSHIQIITFDSIANNLEEAYLQGRLKNYGFYNSLRTILSQAEDKYQKGKYDQAINLLNVVLRKLNFLTPQFIDEETSTQLQEEINLLINYL